MKDVLLFGLAEQGTEQRSINVDSHGNIMAAIEDPVSILGDLKTAPLVPVVQVDYVYGLNANTVKTTLSGSGTATNGNSLAVLSTTAATNSGAVLESVRYLKYRPGQGGVARFTAIFTTGVEGSVQIAGVGNATDGFFVGYNGTRFGVCRRRGGTDYWEYQESWNHETMLTDKLAQPALDPTKGNIYEISYAYLGFSGIRFSVLNGYTNRFDTMHEIRYANYNTSTSVTNPSMNLYFQAVNTTNNTNIVLKSGSGALFNCGEVKRLGAIYGVENTKTGVGTTYTNILTVKCNTTINSITNKGHVVLLRLSVAFNGTKTGSIIALVNTTLGGSPSYTNIDATNSLASYDVAGTTVTGGTQVYAASFGATGGMNIDTSIYDFTLRPGDTITFAGKVSSTTSDISVALTWVEDI